MRKINKSTESNELIEFAQENPESSWDDFRDYNNGREYKAIKSRLFREQSQLCAYCEVDLSFQAVNNRRVEHFNSKSASTPDVNLHLDWSNLLGVCLGGSDFYTKEQGFELPQNLSCDSHKAHIEDVERQSGTYWHGKVLFPLELPCNHELFKFEKSTGKLLPNETYCDAVQIMGNQFESTRALVVETIRVFNLNCERLNKARLKIFREYQKRVGKCRKSRDKSILGNLMLQWSNQNPKEFQTTRDIMIKEANRIIDKL